MTREGEADLPLKEANKSNIQQGLQQAASKELVQTMPRPLKQRQKQGSVQAPPKSVHPSRTFDGDEGAFEQFQPDGLCGFGGSCSSTSRPKALKELQPATDTEVEDFVVENQPTRNFQPLRVFQSCFNDPVGGRPYRSGTIQYFDVTSSNQVSCSALIFSKGLYMIRLDTGEICSFAWSPFSVILRSETHMLSGILGISVSIPTLGRSLQLTVGNETDEEREQWLTDMSLALRTHIREHFPAFTPSVNPLKGVPETHGRLLAGYLLLREHDIVQFSLSYCEIKVYGEGVASLALYSSEDCDRMLSSLVITAKTRIFERSGLDCSSFAIDGHSFCARSQQERKLWLRALNNVKIKLENKAPDPSKDDLEHFRKSVLQKVVEIERDEAWCQNQVPLTTALDTSQISGITTRPIPFNNALRGTTAAGTPDESKSSTDQVAEVSDLVGPRNEGTAPLASRTAQIEDDDEDVYSL